MFFKRVCILGIVNTVRSHIYGICLRARLVDYLFPMSKVLKIRVGRSGKKIKRKKRQKYL